MQIIQAHSEGNTTSPLDLFALYCVENSASGGENVISLLDQSADFARLRAKEKAILGRGLAPRELGSIRREHLDARAVIEGDSSVCRILQDTGRAKLVVRSVPVPLATSALDGRAYHTLWDNVTVHDHAFHRHHYELFRQLEILHTDPGPDYRRYMHVEADSPWAPADTDSGDCAQTARLFACHVLYKMAPMDFMIFHNRAWAHSANNWPAHQKRELLVLYA